LATEGESAWRDRQPPPKNDHSAQLAPAVAASPNITAGVADPAPRLDQEISDDLLAVLSRIQKLNRTVDPDVVDQLHDSTYRSIAQYETLDPATLVAPLRKQRAWLDELIDGCSHPAQRSRLLEVAGMTSGLLGYITVGCAHFSLARAYCQEAYQLGEYARDGNLAAWARGLQSFCEYYAGRFDKALH